jgi:GMP synthase (glutamine-hydrolysing)
VNAPILVVQHETDCPPGWVGDWLVEAGVELDVRHPYRGDALPRNVDGYAGLVVLGGSMGAHDDAEFPWLTATKGLIREGAERALPVLGVCLGHQLAAVAFGGEMRRNPRGQQIGVLPVGWTDEASADDLFGATATRPVRAVQWNKDIVTRMPEGAVVLAATPAGEVQAARFAPTVWGVQWHPEAGYDIIRTWVDEDRDEAAERGIDVDFHVTAVADAEEEMRATWRPLAERFLDIVRNAQPRPAAPVS